MTNKPSLGKLIKLSSHGVAQNSGPRNESSVCMRNEVPYPVIQSVILILKNLVFHLQTTNANIASNPVI